MGKKNSVLTITKTSQDTFKLSLSGWGVIFGISLGELKAFREVLNDTIGEEESCLKGVSNEPQV